MQFNISDDVLKELLKLDAIESGRLGNYTNVDEQLNKVRYRVADLIVSSVLIEVRRLHNAPKLPYQK